jgi:hypothetical protein
MSSYQTQMIMTHQTSLQSPILGYSTCSPLEERKEGTYKLFVSDTCTYIILILLTVLKIKAIQPFTPQLSFVNSSDHKALINYSAFTFNVKLNVCVYTDATSHSYNISKFEVATIV